MKFKLTKVTTQLPPLSQKKRSKNKDLHKSNVKRENTKNNTKNNSKNNSKNYSKKSKKAYGGPTLPVPYYDRPIPASEYGKYIKNLISKKPVFQRACRHTHDPAHIRRTVEACGLELASEIYTEAFRIRENYANRKDYKLGSFPNDHVWVGLKLFADDGPFHMIVGKLREPWIEAAKRAYERYGIPVSGADLVKFMDMEADEIATKGRRDQEELLNSFRQSAETTEEPLPVEEKDWTMVFAFVTSLLRTNYSVGQRDWIRRAKKLKAKVSGDAKQFSILLSGLASGEFTPFIERFSTIVSSVSRRLFPSGVEVWLAPLEWEHADNELLFSSA